MLPLFLQSKIISSKFKVTFSYRYSIKYYQGLIKKIEINDNIFALNFPDILDFGLLPKNIPLIVLRVYFFFIRFLLIYPILIYEIIYFILLFKKLKLDILHINNGGYPGALSCRAAAIAGWIIKVPNIIMVVNNMAVDYASFFRIFDLPIDYFTKKSVNKFITGSKLAKLRIRQVLKLDKRRTISIPNCIKPIYPTNDKIYTLHKLNLTNFDGKIIGVAGLLIERKGHLILLNALVDLIYNKGFTNIKLIIIGDGPLKKELSNFIEKNKLTDYICFTGQVNDPINYISIIDFLVLPSIDNEDFPFVVIEAMNCGKPVIASRVAGTIEQIKDNINGFLFEPRNVIQLVDKITLLLNNDKLLKQMGANSRLIFLNNFTDQQCLTNYLKIYKYY